MNSSRWFAAVLFLCSAAIAPDAAADPVGPPPDTLSSAWTDRARDLYNQGREQFGRKQYEQAHASFRAAWALKKHWQIAAMLGHCEVNLSRWRDAAEHLSWAVRVGAMTAGGPELEAFRTSLSEVRPHVGIVDVRTDLAGAEIRVDGSAVGAAPLADPVFVDPGQHVIEARAEGHVPVVATIVGVAGKSAPLMLHFDQATTAPGAADAAVTGTPPVATAPAGSLAPAPTAAPGEDQGVEARTIAIWSGVGLTAIALGLGIGYTLKKSSASDDATTLKATAVSEHGVGGCADPVAAQSGTCLDLRDAIDRRDSAGKIATGAFISAGVLAVGTAAAFVFWPARSSGAAQSAMLVPSFSTRGGGLTLTGSF